MQIEITGHHFVLLPQRAIFWQEEQALILSDLHIGKGMHFRKGGIPVPNEVFGDDLLTLNNLIQKFSPRSLIIVGDMFHSHYNVEITLFDLWRVQYPQLEIHLVKGNHDILPESKFKELGLTVHELLETDSFIFSHERCEASGKFCFSGHIHPGVLLEGLARQSLRLPCFHFGPDFCTLPAFSKFTGLYLIQPEANDKVFAVVDDEVMAV
jgi:DNA ligase-associated metallophosphoesterase